MTPFTNAPSMLDGWRSAARRIAAGIFSLAILLAAAASLSPAHAGGADEPDRFLLRFSEAYLVYEPGGGAPQIVTEGNVLSYGQDWEIVEMRPFLYHMRQANWQGFYWKVNTSRREVYRVRNGTFGSLGGDEETIGSIAVDPVGSPDDPDRFLLRFSDAYLVHVPNGVLQVTAAGNVLSYGQDWTVDQVEPYRYTMRQQVWRDFHWKIDTARERAYRVTDPSNPCLTDEALDMTVEVVGGGDGTTVFGCVWNAEARPEGEDYPETNPLADLPAAQRVGGETHTATSPRAMVRVAAHASGGALMGDAPVLAETGEYDLHLPAGSGAAEFEVTDAAGGDLLLRTDPVSYPDGEAVRHLLAPGDGPSMGEIPFPDAETGLFTRIGLIEVADIDAAGFARFDGAAAHRRDAPFGGALRMFGAFTEGFYPDTGEGAYCYKVRIDPASGPAFYLDDPVNKRRYLVHADGDVTSESVRLGPNDYADVDDCYRLTPLSMSAAPGDPADVTAVFWSFPDLLAHWRTGRRNGAHEVSLELYEIAGGDRVSLDPNDNMSLDVYLDNTPIDLSFDTLELHGPSGALETDLLADRCAMAELRGNRELHVDYTAFHATGFLSRYSLAATSNSGVRAWTDADSYPAGSWSGARPPAFEGRASSAGPLTRTGDDFTAGPCAYVLDLHAAARTTNGYTRINRGHRRLFYFFEP